MTVHKWSLIFAITCMAPVSVASANSAPRPWTISIVAGGPLGGPTSDLQNAMTRDGFAGVEYSFFGGGAIYYPRVDTDFPDFVLRLDRYISSKTSLSACYSNVSFGETHGTHDLNITTTAMMLAIVSNVNVKDVFRIGVGPALYGIRAREIASEGDPNANEYTATKFGFVLDAGVRLPGNRRVFGEFTVQYRYIGELEAGMFDATEGVVPLVTTYILNESILDFNHVFLGFGFGIHF